jgi:hypothetical protein
LNKSGKMWQIYFCPLFFPSRMPMLRVTPPAQNMKRTLCQRYLAYVTAMGYNYTSTVNTVCKTTNISSSSSLSDTKRKAYNRK